MLSLHRITCSYGPVEVLSDVSVKLKPGSRLGLCGTNGSGKSTVINIASGFVKPIRGEIFIDQEPFTGKPPWYFARAGIVRTFQIPRFMSSVVLGKQLGTTKLAIERGRAIVSDCGIAHYNDAFKDEIPLVPLKIFEIARSIAVQPNVLLLDEPSAGLSQSDATNLFEAITRHLNKTCSLIVVEHRQDFMRRLADQVVELIDGKFVSQPGII